MRAIRTPGFTAEASLYRGMDGYSGLATRGQVPATGAVAAAFKDFIWPGSYHCVVDGFSGLICTFTAGDDSGPDGGGDHGTEPNQRCLASCSAACHRRPAAQRAGCLAGCADVC